MPSTFSPSLRIELIGDGEQSGVWGQTTNNNLGDLLEQAIAGRTALNVTAGNLTLTSLNGVVDEARSAVLAVTGTPGVTRILTIPNVKKTYTVINSTANIVQIKTASGSAYDCAPLSQSYVNCDGVNVVTGRSITDGANVITSLAAPFNSPSFTGNVGIGTATATLPLTIGDSTLPAGATIDGQMISSDVAAATALLSIRRSSASGNPGLAQFASSGTAAVPTAVALNRGLGRNDWLGFDGTNYINAAAITTAVDGVVSAGVVPGRMVFSTSTTNTPVERMRITSSGDVGIGTATPSAPLHVEGGFNSFNANGNGVLLGTDASYSVIRLNQTTGGVIYFSESGANPKGIIQYVNSTNKMSFFTTNIERMSVSLTDGILLSRSTPVAGTGSSVSVSYAPNSVHGITLQAVSTVFTNNAIRFLNISDGVSGTITQTASTVAYNTSSDYRLKENIAPMTGALAKVAALKPVTYTWKIDGVAGQGFIAHELQEVIPDCVAGTKDAVDENGNVLPQGVDTSFLVATLTAAIQEQQAIISAMEARLAALESK